MQTKGYIFSVVIPHLNQPEALECCLRSLEAQTLERELFEVIVADNGSAQLPKVAERGFRVRLVQELEPGPGAARNRGAAAASGEILAFIDADCRAHCDWLKNALCAMQSAPPRTALGGDVQIWRDDPNTFSALEAYESVFAYRFKLYIEKHGFSGTGNLVVKRKDFYGIGPFEGIQFAEDIEWGRRARAAGFTLKYAAGMIVYHPARKTMKELFVKWDRHLQHYVNKARGRQGWQLAWLARALATLASPAIDWTKVVLSDRVHGTSARAKAIAVMIAVRAYRFAKMMTLLFSSVWNQADLVRDASSQSASGKV